MRVFNYNFSLRHLAKTITWRIVATFDTIIIAYFISGSLELGIKIGSIEILTKMILYYIHERLWFKSKFVNYRIRHILKTFSWRLIGTMDTIIISLFIIGSFSAGLKIGFIETTTKMILYYIHEKLWYRVNLGLDTRKNLVR